ncbi:MAG: DUF885 family protein [Armatimonadaceae bacterium]
MRISRWIIRRLTCACSVLLLSTPVFAQSIPVETPSPVEPFIRRYETDADGLLRFYVYGSVGQQSTSVRERQRTFYQSSLEQLEKSDYNSLTSSGKADYHLLKDHLENELRQLDFARKRQEEMEPLLPFRDAVVALEEARGRREPVNPEAAASELTRIAESVRKAREQKRTVSPSLALRTAGAVGQLRGALANWFGYYNGFKPLFSWWCQKPYEQARQELDQYEKHLRENLAGIKGKDEDPLIGDPIGREELLSDLRHERIPYSPEEMIAIAEKEFAWCEAEMKRAAGEMGMGDDWKKALEAVKQDHVPPGEQDNLVAKQAEDAIAFVESRDLVTIDPLCKETWRLEMIGPAVQKTLPFAAYGGQRMLVAYPTDEMDHSAKQMSLRGNNIAFTRIVTPHELIPGHHLQRYMSDRYRTYRQLFSTPFYVEGWALYWEMQLWDRNYAQTPQQRIGMLFWRMHRCARIIVSLNFHLGKMKPNEMIDFLVDRVGHERFTATSEVRRFIGGAYSPLYQCAYMIGGLQIRALYRELVEAGKMTPKAFHDAVLKENAIPIEILRAILTENPLPRDGKPEWKFYDLNK